MKKLQRGFKGLEGGLFIKGGFKEASRGFEGFKGFKEALKGAEKGAEKGGFKGRLKGKRGLKGLTGKGSLKDEFRLSPSCGVVSTAGFKGDSKRGLKGGLKGGFKVGLKEGLRGTSRDESYFLR